MEEFLKNLMQALINNRPLTEVILSLILIIIVLVARLLWPKKITNDSKPITLKKIILGIARYNNEVAKSLEIKMKKLDEEKGEESKQEAARQITFNLDRLINFLQYFQHEATKKKKFKSEELSITWCYGIYSPDYRHVDGENYGRLQTLFGIPTVTENNKLQPYDIESGKIIDLNDKRLKELRYLENDQALIELNTMEANTEELTIKAFTGESIDPYDKNGINAFNFGGLCPNPPCPAGTLLKTADNLQKEMKEGPGSGQELEKSSDQSNNDEKVIGMETSDSEFGYR